MRRTVASIACLALLGGCVQINQPAPVIRNYRLSYAPPEAATARLNAIVHVPSFAVAATYDSQAIMYRKGAFELNRYFYDRWASNPGDMVAGMIARDMAESRVFQAVQHARAPLVSDYRLAGEIESIEERIIDDGCAARLELRVLLVALRGSHPAPVLLRERFTEMEPCRCGSGASVAAAMSKAVQRLSNRLLGESHDAILADQEGRRP